MNREIKPQYESIIIEEGDYESFISNGYKCRLIRTEVGHWCGYVGLPKNHNLYGKTYDEIGVEVHGGITYCDNNLFKQPEKNLRWFGFDTAHLGDDGIYITDYKFNVGGRTIYRDKEYVKEQTKHLAKQLANYKK